ncbi:hypothetical protein CLU81_1548 [Flavobacterium sp. 9]|nr:hypothetical protein CLU81_1548 [Flavobacterium sp. 9]
MKVFLVYTTRQEQDTKELSKHTKYRIYTLF